jgi:hypothetical protein
MNQSQIYHERIVSKLNLAILGLVVLWLGFSVLYPILDGSVASDPAATWVLVFFGTIFAILMANFVRLNILITSESLTVNYGMIAHHIPLENIERCYLDQTSAIKYGGFGIRIARIDGKWRLVYNLAASPRVVLLLKSGSFREFVFSTENPDEVLRIINDRSAAPKS